jgi:MFS family permease
MSSQQRISLRSYWQLVRTNPNFRRLWTAQIVSEMGDWFYMVSLYAMLLEFTGRAESVALAFVLQVLPQALVGPFAGVINDRISRRKVMIFTDVMRALIVACVLFVRTPAMVWLVYPLLFLETTMWGLFEPARTAVIPNIVEKDETLVANTLASSTWSLNLFLGAAVGGAAAVWLGRDAVFALDAASFLFSAFMIARMRFAEPHVAARPPARWRDFFDHSDVVEGARYVGRDPRLRSAILVKGVLGVTGASWVIFPVLGKTVFPVTGAGISPEHGVLLGISLLMGARGLGTLLGPIVIAPWAGQRTARLRAGILLGFVLYGLGYVALGGIARAPVAYAAVIFSHMGGAMVWVFSTTLLQLLTEDRFRGRVFAAELAFCTVMLAVSAQAAGWAIDHGVDVRRVSLATGVVTLAAGSLWAVFGAREKAAPAAS